MMVKTIAKMAMPTMIFVSWILSAGAQEAVLSDAPIITEFMAKNDGSLPVELGGLLDEQGEDSDWIELYNPSYAPVDLGGWFLSDDPEDLSKWEFPPQTWLDPASFIIVFASGMDRRDPTKDLHTNFQLSGSGEFLALVQPDATTTVSVYEPRYPEQMTNVSYGYSLQDDVLAQRYFSTPTPGAMNTDERLGRVKAVTFSHERGFYKKRPDSQTRESESTSVNKGFYRGAFLLTLATVTPDAEIRVTLDGTMPSTDNGFSYLEPLPISETSLVRAVAIKPGYFDSPSVTHTFLFLDDIVQQSLDGQSPGPGWPEKSVNGQRFEFGLDRSIVNDDTWGPQLEEALVSIPSISLVTDLKHLFDPEIGIYVNANFSGREWERPMSLELIYPPNPQGPGFPDLVRSTDEFGEDHWLLPESMRVGFQINAGVRIRGGYSRIDDNPKHAFRVFFRNEYGANELRYPLFGSEGTDHFDKFDLRTAQNYSWSFGHETVVSGGQAAANTLCRDVWARDTQGVMEQPYTRSRFYHLYMNGHYWGIYQTQERADAAYGASYLGGDRDSFDTIKSTGFLDGGVFSGGWVIEATDGDVSAWRALWNLANAGFDKHANYYRAQGLNPDGTRNPDYPVLLDVDNLIDYMLLIFFGGDRDAPITDFWNNTRTNNWFGIRDRSGTEGFKFFIHDAEHILSRGSSDRTGPYSAGQTFPYSNPQWIHQKLMAHPDYLMRFADRSHRHLFHAGLLTPAKTIERFENRAQQIGMAIIAESARWGNIALTKDTWQRAVEIETLGFLPRRTEFLISQLQGTRLRDGSQAPLYPEVEAPLFVPTAGNSIDGTHMLISTAGGTIYYTLDGSDPRLPEAASSQPLIPEQAAKRVLILFEPPEATFWEQWAQPSLDDSSWMHVVGNVGYDLTDEVSAFDEIIDLDVQGAMYNVNSSCLMRIPFTLDHTRWATLMLGVRYDAGFVAHLNGAEILRINEFTGRGSAPGRWNSKASEERDATLAKEFQYFDLWEHSHLLVEGGNILALQGLNLSHKDEDFLLSVALWGRDHQLNLAPTASIYDGPVALHETTLVKARAYDGVWSALHETLYSVGPAIQSLLITEIMYHPLDTNEQDNANAEFVELLNNSSESFDVALTQFTQGIRFTFPHRELVPGERVLVVKDKAAFEAVYGTGLPVVGQYQGSLSNRGERLVLADASGLVLADFTYDDRWYDSTDGGGFSLTLVETVDISVGGLSEKRAWSPSVARGGSPGR